MRRALVPNKSIMHDKVHKSGGYTPGGNGQRRILLTFAAGGERSLLPNKSDGS